MRISDWSSDVCSSDLCRWFLTCSSHGKLCNASVRGAFMALTKRWAGRAWGTNIGNVFVTLEGEDAALSGTLRMNEEGVHCCIRSARLLRSEEHTSELQSLMRISYAVFCLKKKKNKHTANKTTL